MNVCLSLKRDDKIMILAIIFLFLRCGDATERLDVLMLGNSYTYFNDMPSMVKSMALKQNYDLNIVYYAQNNGELMVYLDSNILDNYINRAYDVVVIQEQSTNPAKSIRWVQENTFPTARKLVDKIRSYGNTRIIFYDTWGRPGKHEEYDCNDINVQFCSYEGMQSRLSETYTTMAYLNQPAEVAPVGEVYRYMRNKLSYNTWEDFYNATDKSHPTISGSYAIAATITSSITGKKQLPTSTWLPPNGLYKAQADMINKAVNKVVFNPDWTYGGYWKFNKFSNPPCRECIRYNNREYTQLSRNG